MGWQHDPDGIGRPPTMYTGGKFLADHDKPFDSKSVPVGDHRDNEEDDYINDGI